MKSGKHILLISPGFPCDENDDICIPPLQDYARSLAKPDDIKVSVITLQYPGNKSIYKWYGIDVYSCGGNDSAFPKRVISWRNAVEFFKTINNNSKVDVIHSFWLSECALLGNYLSKKFSVNHVNTMMGQELRSTNYYLHFIKLKKMQIISLSERQAEFLNGINYHNIKIVTWGLNTNSIPQQTISERKIDVLGVGSLTKLKNYSAFLNIVHLVKKAKPEIKCAIIGDGPLKEKLQEEIKKLDLKNNVELTGTISRQQVFDFMMKSKILLHTSSFESFGMIFIEALFYGLHIISKPVGIAEKSEKWSIYNNENEMAKEVLRLLSNTISYDPVTLYTMDKTVKSYLDIYFPVNQTIG